MTQTPSSRVRLLAWVLLLLGILDVCAFPAIFLSDAMMERIHEQLGLGSLTVSPLVSYLTRTASMMYVLYGAILIFVSRNVLRYLPLIRLLAILAVVQAVFLIGIDLRVKLPLWWVLLEGPFYGIGGLFLYWLQKPLAD